MRMIKTEVIEEVDEAQILKEKQRQQQIEMEKKAKKKEAMANKFSFMQAKAIDKFAIEQRFQLQTVKEAIANNTMTVDRANEILFKKTSTENAKLMKNVIGKRSNSVSRFMKKIVKFNA